MTLKLSRLTKSDIAGMLAFWGGRQIFVSCQTENRFEEEKKYLYDFVNIQFDAVQVFEELVESVHAVEFHHWLFNFLENSQGHAEQRHPSFVEEEIPDSGNHLQRKREEGQNRS